MNDHNTLREQVSALVDGQLQGEDFAQAVEQVCSHDELRSTWHTYHVVGEVLRSGQHVVCRDSATFLAGFRQRLTQEGSLPSQLAAPALAPGVGQRAEAANQPVFRWKLLAGVASLAAAAAIGWNWIGGAVQSSAGAQLAQQGSAAPVLASSVQATAADTTTTTRVLLGDKQQPQVMLRDPRLDALLEAHQQAGGASHMPSGFLRNATFEGQSR